MASFSVGASHGWSARNGWVTKFKLVEYRGSGTSCVVESNEKWSTKEEAEAVCARVNAGDESGLTFSSYADD